MVLQEGSTGAPVGVLPPGKRIVRGALELAQQVPIMESACRMTINVQL